MKQEIIYWSRLLNERGLVTSRSGNVSCRSGDGRFLTTCTGTYLGHLKEEEIVEVTAEGHPLESGKTPTSEKALHLGVYARRPDVNAVVHAHSPFTVAYFHYFSRIELLSFESELYLGEVPVIDQFTITVTDVEPVLDAFTGHDVVVLRRHGVVAAGRDFREAFSLIELLEEQCRVQLIIKASKTG
jgi:L-fuculose-phosphate aldolase